MAQERTDVTNQKQLQTIVWMYRYNALRQVIRTISPEGNMTTHEHFPEEGESDESAATFNNNIDSIEADIKSSYTYDDLGNAVTMSNPRDIQDDYFVNEFD